MIECTCWLDDKRGLYCFKVREDTDDGKRGVILVAPLESLRSFMEDVPPGGEYPQATLVYGEGHIASVKRINHEDLKTP